METINANTNRVPLPAGKGGQVCIQREGLRNSCTSCLLCCKLWDRHKAIAVESNEFSKCLMYCIKVRRGAIIGGLCVYMCAHLQFFENDFLERVLQKFSSLHNSFVHKQCPCPV